MGDERRWTLLTNHGACLLILASAEGSTIREVAAAMGVTQRSVARVLADLRTAGYISVRREGRRNCYSINLDAPLRHPVVVGHSVNDLLSGLLDRFGP